MLTTQNETLQIEQIKESSKVASKIQENISASRLKDEMFVLKTQIEELQIENKTLKRQIEQIKQSSKVASEIHIILHC